MVLVVQTIARTQKTQRQERFWTIRPPKRGPRVGPRRGPRRYQPNMDLGLSAVYRVFRWKGAIGK